MFHISNMPEPDQAIHACACEAYRLRQTSTQTGKHTSAACCLDNMHSWMHDSYCRTRWLASISQLMSSCTALVSVLQQGYCELLHAVNPDVAVTVIAIHAGLQAIPS
jgi:hypothetical protein